MMPEYPDIVVYHRGAQKTYPRSDARACFHHITFPSSHCAATALTRRWQEGYDVRRVGKRIALDLKMTSGSYFI